MNWKVLKGNREAKRYAELLKGDTAFLFVIGNTRTAEISGITVAGANPEMIKYTPPADVELLYYGKCKTISKVPATPDGKPTPALITYTALKLTQVPFFIVDSGLIAKPLAPYLTINAPVGGNIGVEKAMDIESVKEVFDRAVRLGEQLSKLVDVLIVGESIPAGTTTAGAVLRAFGVRHAVSSSMPKNPVKLKEGIIKRAVERVKSDDPLEIIAEVGDPVMLGISGIAVGSSKPVLLAGGTQMAAIAHVIRRIKDVELAIATTVYIVEDPTADIAGISPVAVIAVDPGLAESSKPGLRAYASGFVKEGVGAGGATFLAYVRGASKKELLREIEKNYERIISE
jgi:uncharacterized protein (TIGR00303 family)